MSVKHLLDTGLPRGQCWRQPGDQHRPEDHRAQHPAAGRGGAELRRAPHPVLPLALPPPHPHRPPAHVRHPTALPQRLPGGPVVDIQLFISEI